MKKTNHALAIKKFKLNVSGTYNKDGVQEFEKTELEGSNLILLSTLFSLIKGICKDAEVPYREVLSNEIKRDVTAEAWAKNKEAFEDNGK